MEDKSATKKNEKTQAEKGPGVNGAGTGAGDLSGEYERLPENTLDHIRKKDKDPDERALGSDGGRKGQMPNYDELRNE